MFAAWIGVITVYGLYILFMLGKFGKEKTNSGKTRIYWEDRS